MLYHDDCFNVFPQIPDKSIDLVLCDMPYGTTACKWDSIIDLKSMWIHLNKISKGNSAIILFSQMPFSATLVASNATLFRYNWIWDKGQGTGHLNAKKSPLKNHEEIQVFYKNQCTYNPQFTTGAVYKQLSGKVSSKNYGKQIRVLTDNKGIRYPKTILSFSRDKPSIHPTQKPFALMQYLIKTYSNEGDTVLDFCMGSGTTGVACKNLNRQFIGIEKEKEYYDIAIQRISS